MKPSYVLKYKNKYVKGSEGCTWYGEKFLFTEDINLAKQFSFKEIQYYKTYYNLEIILVKLT